MSAAPLFTREDAVATLRDVVRLELEHWVPGGSQRLIGRAGRLLGLPVPTSEIPDCGPTMGQHALIADWIADLYVLRCCVCARLYAHDWHSPADYD